MAGGEKREDVTPWGQASQPCFVAARVMVLSAVGTGRRNIRSGLECGCCKVHNGLALERAQRP